MKVPGAKMIEHSDIAIASWRQTTVPGGPAGPVAPLGPAGPAGPVGSGPPVPDRLTVAGLCGSLLMTSSVPARAPWAWGTKNTVT